MRRFDELEILPGVPDGDTLAIPTHPHAPGDHSVSAERASRGRRLLTTLSDLSLFVALAIALSTLLPHRGSLAATIELEWPSVLSLAGFILLLSYFYFTGCWVIWGKTAGGAIFDLRVLTRAGEPVDLARASRRWLWTILSLATLGLGFFGALLPGALSMPDRMSGTRSYEWV